MKCWDEGIIQRFVRANGMLMGWEGQAIFKEGPEAIVRLEKWRNLKGFSHKLSELNGNSVVIKCFAKHFQSHPIWDCHRVEVSTLPVAPRSWNLFNLYFKTFFMDRIKYVHYLANKFNCFPPRIRCCSGSVFHYPAINRSGSRWKNMYFACFISSSMQSINIEYIFHLVLFLFMRPIRSWRTVALLDRSTYTIEMLSIGCA